MTNDEHDDLYFVAGWVFDDWFNNGRPVGEYTPAVGHGLIANAYGDGTTPEFRAAVHELVFEWIENGGPEE